MKMSKNKKYFLNILLLFIFSFGVMYFFLKDDFENVAIVLYSAQWQYVIIGLLLMIIFYFLEAISLKISINRYYKDYKFSESLKAAFVGVFFSAITPSASGGQVGQVYVLKKQKISSSSSLSALLLNFIIFQFAIIFVSTLTLLFRYNYYSTILPSMNIFGYEFSFLTLTFIGFLINFIVIVTLLFLGYSKRVHKFIFGIGTIILKKLRIVKDTDKFKINLVRKGRAFRNEMSDWRKNKYPMIYLFIIQVVKLLILYSIPFICALALNFNYGFLDFLESIALGSYVNLMSSYFPIPGASGGTEAFFAVLYRLFFVDKAHLTSAIIIWRSLTFYFGLLVSAIVVIFTFSKKGDVGEVENESSVV